MSKPKDGDLRQLATWVPKRVKDDLEKKAAREKKPERKVVEEALEAHLRAKTEDDEGE